MLCACVRATPGFIPGRAPVSYPASHPRTPRARALHACTCVGRKTGSSAPVCRRACVRADVGLRACVCWLARVRACDSFVLVGVRACVRVFARACTRWRREPLSYTCVRLFVCVRERKRAIYIFIYMYMHTYMHTKLNKERTHVIHERGGEGGEPTSWLPRESSETMISLSLSINLVLPTHPSPPLSCVRAVPAGVAISVIPTQTHKHTHAVPAGSRGAVRDNLLQDSQPVFALSLSLSLVCCAHV